VVATTLDDTFIPRGTPVYSSDGEKLGVMTNADPYEMVIEHGVFFVQHYHVRLSDVDRYNDGKLILRLTKAQVEEHITPAE
jgi:hypothetical protein